LNKKTNLIDQFAAQLNPADSKILTDLRDFVEWQTQRQGTTFIPAAIDDVAIRSYLLHLKLNLAGQSILQRTIASLKHFYDWVKSNALIADSPFDSFDFNRPLLSREQVRRREERRFADQNHPKIAHLQALNHLAEHLNRSVDMRGLIDTVVETLVQVMGLKTAWAFLWTKEGFYATIAPDSPHDFALAACCGLPPGLEKDDRRFLCQPPDCYCQDLLRNNRLVRAVNVVECTRLQDAVSHNGDTKGLLFHATVPLISQNQPLGLINVATERWEFLTAADLQFLSAAGSHAAIALERARLYDLAETQRVRMEQELEMARSVQQSLLPSETPRIPGFALMADWRSAREVAGDFYDFFRLPDGRWGIVLADVSGKGAPAALYMAVTRSMIRSEAMRYSSPSSVLTEVNRRLIAESKNENMFVTVFYAILEPRSRGLTYANAGHDPPFLRHTSGEVERLDHGGLLLGIFEPTGLTDAVLVLEKGEALVVYTDGVPDTVNQQDEDYGHPRLADTIKTGPNNARDMLTHILDDLATFAGTAPQPDDITLLILKSEEALGPEQKVSVHLANFWRHDKWGLKNTSRAFGGLAKFFHWAVFLIFVNQFISATLMTSPLKGNLFAWHYSFGLLVLALAFARFGWRKVSRLPDWPDTMQTWEQKLLPFIERGLYAAMFIMPLSGLLQSISNGYAVPFFSLFEIPGFSEKNPTLTSIGWFLHKATSYIIIAFITLHLFSVVRRHLFEKDGYLRRMLPFTKISETNKTDRQT